MQCDSTGANLFGCEAYGCVETYHVWSGYFGLAGLFPNGFLTTSRTVVEELCLMVYTNETLWAQFLCRVSHQDAVHILEMDEEHHGIAGMFGSLDSMHVRWRTSPFALQGAYIGKEKYSTIVLEAVAYHNLWFWHTTFGFAGSCYNINILDASLLHKNFVNGSHSLIDFDFTIGNAHIFSKLFYLFDGIYPSLSHFVKTICPYISQKERKSICC